MWGCGVEEEKRFIEIISNIDPHSFYVDPKHRTIHFHAIFYYILYLAGSLWMDCPTRKAHRLRSTRLSLARRCLVAHTSPVEGDGNGNNTPKPPPLNRHTPPTDGGNGNNTPLRKYFGFGFGWTIFRDGLLWNYLNVQRVMKAIKVSKLEMPQVDGYIERNQEMKAFKRKLYNSEDLKTTIVTGSLY